VRERFFNWLGYVTYRRYWLVLLVCLAVTVVFGYFAGKIRMEATWLSMLEKDSPSVKSFQTIIDEFGAATNIIVALEGEDTEQLKKIADTISFQLADLNIEYLSGDGSLDTMKAFKRIDHRYDQDFIENHGLMLEKAKNLKKNKLLFTDYNLVPFLTHVNDVYEAQWVSDSDNLTKQEKEAEQGLDGMFQLFHTISAFARGETDDSTVVQKGVDALTLGDGYYLSSDKKMLLIFISPSMSINEIDPSVVAVDSLDNRLLELMTQWPDVRYGTTGMHVLMRDEMQSGIEDTVNNLTIALILILAIFIVSFRMWTGPILAMLVLVTGVVWDTGLAQLIYGRLNIMTAICSVILVGLGVDYAIHMISAFTELRHKGESIENAIAKSFQKIGNGLLTGALTTAIAFLSLVVIGSDAFREFGLVVGLGIICCLLASLFLLPAILVTKEKLWRLFTTKEFPKRIDMEFKFLGKTADVVTSRSWITVILVVVLTAFLVWQIPSTRMNRNYMDLEPEGLESIRLQREIVKRFHMSPDNMMAVYKTIDEVDRVQDFLNSKPSVGMVESIATVLPTEEKQTMRRPYLIEIRERQKKLPPEKSINAEMLAEQLHRLSDNIIEISSSAYINGLDRVFDKANQFIGLDEEGNQIGVNYAEKLAEYIKEHPEAIANLKKYQWYFRPLMKKRLEKMSNTESITIGIVPETYYDRYVSKDSSHFLMAFYSRKDIWDGLMTSPFIMTLQRAVPEATGTPVFMREMVEARKKDGPLAFGVAFLAIFILLLWDFRSVKTTIVALLPLVISVTWLFGIMGLFDINFTIVNVIGFPLLIGIGIDDGVHVIHRYRLEGKAKLSYTMASIGKPILLTSLTTMLGFGSLIFSTYRGYIGFGLLVTLGIGLCFVASVLILPAILKIVWGGKKEHPRFFL